MYHFGDPCIHCNIPHDDVPVGPCTGDPAKVVPIAYCSMGVRWDGVERFRVLRSDGKTADCWRHVSERVPYHDFRKLRHERPNSIRENP